MYVMGNLKALMPTLPDYPGVSRIQKESPSLPYSLPNLPDIFMKDEKSSKFYLQIKKKILGFLFKDGCIFVKFYLILVYVCPT